MRKQQEPPPPPSTLRTRFGFFPLAFLFCLLGVLHAVLRPCPFFGCVLLRPPETVLDTVPDNVPARRPAAPPIVSFRFISHLVVSFRVASLENDRSRRSPPLVICLTSRVFITARSIDRSADSPARPRAPRLRPRPRSAIAHAHRISTPTLCTSRCAPPPSPPENNKQTNTQWSRQPSESLPSRPRTR